MLARQSGTLYALYPIPALYSAWFLGSRWGYGICVASALIWLSDDFIQEELHRYSFASDWNLISRAVVLAFIVALVNSLRRTLELKHELENQVVQRELDMAR